MGVEKYRCAGCSKQIVRKPGQRKRKFHDYGCFAKVMYKSWGMSPRAGKFAAEIQRSRQAAVMGTKKA